MNPGIAINNFGGSAAATSSRSAVVPTAGVASHKTTADRAKNLGAVGTKISKAGRNQQEAEQGGRRKRRRQGLDDRLQDVAARQKGGGGGDHAGNRDERCA